AVEETFLSRFEQRQVCFVIDHTDIRCRFFARLSALELDVILVCNQVGSDKNATLGQNRSERAFRKGRLLLPRPKIIISLSSDIHAHERDLFWLGSRGRNGRFFLCQRTADGDENYAESDESVSLHFSFYPLRLRRVTQAVPQDFALSKRCNAP